MLVDLNKIGQSLQQTAGGTTPLGFPVMRATDSNNEKQKKRLGKRGMRIWLCVVGTVCSIMSVKQRRHLGGLWVRSSPGTVLPNELRR